VSRAQGGAQGGQWGPWLDRVSEYFGELSTAQFDRPDKIRPVIRRWRNQWSATPRTADYAVQVLSRLCAFAIDPLGELANNPCAGIAQLYSVNRARVIWLEADLAQLKKTCSPEIAHAVDLAVHTGLRLGDLLRLSWSHVGDDAIVLLTSKSRGSREATIPLHDALREMLVRIPKRATTVLTNSRGRPWTPDGFESSFIKAKAAAGMAGRDLHFHDLRGTAATRFYAAGLSLRVIAEILAWEEDRVDKIIRRYVERSAATRAAIRQMRVVPITRRNGE
jgi:integrase